VAKFNLMQSFLWDVIVDNISNEANMWIFILQLLSLIESEKLIKMSLLH